MPQRFEKTPYTQRRNVAFMIFLLSLTDLFGGLPYRVVKTIAGIDVPQYNYSSICIKKRTWSGAVEVGSQKQHHQDDDDEPDRSDDSNERLKGMRMQAQEYPDWSNYIERQTRFSYYYGFAVGSVPAGLIVTYAGPRKTIIVTVMLSAILVVISIPMVNINWVYYCINRFAIGAMGSVIYPSCVCLTKKWSTPNEITIFFACQNLGVALGCLIRSYIIRLIAKPWGWRYCFFIFIIIYLVFLIFWFYFITDSPLNNRRISEKERNYIHSFTSLTVSEKKFLPPYYLMLSNPNIWAITLGEFGHTVAMQVTLLSLPRYVNTIIRKRHSAIPDIPLLANLVGTLLFATGADWLISKKVFYKTSVTKFSILFSHFFPAAFLMALKFAECNYDAIVILLTLMLTLNSSICVSLLRVSYDMAPNYTETTYAIMGVGNACSNIVGKLITDKFTRDHEVGLKDWAKVFNMAGAIYALSGAVWLCFGAGDIQPWNWKEGAFEEPEEEIIVEEQQAEPETKT